MQCKEGGDFGLPFKCQGYIRLTGENVHKQRRMSRAMYTPYSPTWGILNDVKDPGKTPAERIKLRCSLETVKNGMGHSV